MHVVSAVVAMMMVFLVPPMRVARAGSTVSIGSIDTKEILKNS